MGREVAVVLFSDLVGSIELWARVGEEIADELRRDRMLLTRRQNVQHDAVAVVP